MKKSSLLGVITLGLSVVIGGCGGDDTSDLRQFVEQVKARDPGTIEPLPEIKQVETFVYNAISRRNPFEPSSESTTDTIAAVDNGIAPNPLRRKEELENFALDSIRMVGTMEQNQSTWGLVKVKDGTIFRVKAGNYLGLNHGQITRVSEEKIELTEIITDGTGGYVERQASLALSE